MSLLPISLTSDIEQYINLSKDTNATQQKTFTFSTSTFGKRAPPGALGFPTSTQWAEDTPTGISKDDTGLALTAADNTAYSRTFAWRVPRTFKLEKLVFNIGFCMNLSANAGGDASFDSFSVNCRERRLDGSENPIINTGTVGTGFGLATGAIAQLFIYEDSFKPNMEINESSIILITLAMSCTGGTATRQEGICPAFPYNSANVLKWYSQSGIYLLGSSILPRGS